jgi:hypothetical protein
MLVINLPLEWQESGQTFNDSLVISEKQVNVCSLSLSLSLSNMLIDSLVEHTHGILCTVKMPNKFCA